MLVCVNPLITERQSGHRTAERRREGEIRMGSWEPDNAELASRAADCTARCFWCIYLLVTSLDGLGKMFIHKTLI